MWLLAELLRRGIQKPTMAIPPCMPKDTPTTALILATALCLALILFGDLAWDDAIARTRTAMERLDAFQRAIELLRELLA